MSSYERPRIETPVFRDAGGKIIEYGHRWNDSPPEDTYTVTAHPERFAPLHTVADALIEHLQETYDVQVKEGSEVARDLLRPNRGVTRAVRIRPIDATCAPVTLVFTTYPGLSMHAGLLHDFHYPDCGCDACDSNWQQEADYLERQVFAVVTGNYRERIERGLRRWIVHSFAYPDGRSSGPTGSRDVSAERLETAEPILRDLPNGWAPWPPSTGRTR